MKLIIIAAISENYVIGRENKIPWSIPEDLKRFRELTETHPVIMGRKTYQSLPLRPLEDRLNIVLTRGDFSEKGIFVFKSLEESLQSLEKQEPSLEGIDYSQAYIIGGASIYESSLSIADMLEITWVKREVLGDTYFPEINFDQWITVNEDLREGYSFVSYVRRIG